MKQVSFIRQIKWHSKACFADNMMVYLIHKRTNFVFDNFLREGNCACVCVCVCVWSSNYHDLHKMCIIPRRSTAPLPPPPPPSSFLFTKALTSCPLVSSFLFKNSVISFTCSNKSYPKYEHEAVHNFIHQLRTSVLSK